MKIITIAALGKNRVIGKNNDLLWHLPNDFKYFKKETTGSFIIMGRKTFESLPKPLPNRTHVVITRQNKYEAPEGIIIVNNLQQAFDYAKKQQQEKVYIIGGAQIYEQTLNIANELILTEVDYNQKGDAYFPDFDKKNYTSEVVFEQLTDEKHTYAFKIIKYRIK